MPAHRTIAFGTATLGGFLLFAANSVAHIDLTSPAPRIGGRPDTYLKTGPCGQQSNARVPSKVLTLRPGQQLTLVWDEYIQHGGYYRIAVDLDGDDSFSSRDPAGINAASDDPALLSPGAGEIVLDYMKDMDPSTNHFERTVTLPDEECENCTLQVIQFMYGSSAARSTYHQCVDLVLDEDAPGPDGAGGSANAIGGSGGEGEGDSNLGAAGTMATSARDSGAGPEGDADAVDEESGCSLARLRGSVPRGSGSRAFGFGLLLLLGVGLGTRRRRR
jgi:hypothetical protein